ncbi:MAG: malonic semialdehyde reductase [Sideroxydans sp.]
MFHQPLPQNALDQLFFEAHTCNGWQERAVPQILLHQLYDTLRMAPTSMNSNPARIVFVQSKAAKEKLLPALMEGNRAKTLAAPVTAIIGHDMQFYQHLPHLMPQIPGAREMFANDAALAEVNAFRNGTLQGAYLILAARALGLDCGPMSGFNNAMVDELFFAGTSIKSNFLCNLGYATPDGHYPRNPRLSFAEACRIE